MEDRRSQTETCVTSCSSVPQLEEEQEVTDRDEEEEEEEE